MHCSDASATLPSATRLQRIGVGSRSTRGRPYTCSYGSPDGTRILDPRNYTVPTCYIVCRTLWWSSHLCDFEHWIKQATRTAILPPEVGLLCLSPFARVIE
uniref:Uncharacterized protein n=1 Tax=Ixodes ricinus TaxID=34613 RepID=A0A0K8R2P1_IXORI